MIRAYDFVLAALAKIASQLQDYRAAKNRAHRHLSSRWPESKRRMAGALCGILVLSQLVPVSPSAAPLFADWGRQAQRSMARWTDPNAMPTKLFSLLVSALVPQRLIHK